MGRWRWKTGPRWLAGVLLVLVSVHGTGCTTWRTNSASPEQLVTEKRPERIRVTGPDSSQFVLARPSVTGDTLRGWDDQSNAERTMPLGDVRRLETRRFDPLLAAMWVGVGFGALFLLACATASEDDWVGPC